MTIEISSMLGEEIKTNKLLFIKNFFQQVQNSDPDEDINSIYITEELIFKPTAKFVLKHQILKSQKDQSQHGFAVLLPQIISSMSIRLIIISTKMPSTNPDERAIINFNKKDFKKLKSKNMWNELNEASYDDALSDEKSKTPNTFKVLNYFKDSSDYYDPYNKISLLLFVLRIYLKSQKNHVVYF